LIRSAGRERLAEYLMNGITTLFWDIGGVILTNGWDAASREEAARRFSLDGDEFESRHREAEAELETGQITLDTYLDRTISFQNRPFSREQFKAFIFGQSAEKQETRAVLDELSASRTYFVAALNNESLELNSFRIRKFDLTRNFASFLTSCYLRLRKPDVRMYETALGITQRAPQECIFIDDRPANLEPAKALGMHAILFRSAAELRASLAEYGVFAPVER
jgi:putative hydrolase of the HAD superfamily